MNGDDQLGLFAPEELPETLPVEPARAPDAHHELARRLPAGIHLGTSSWSFPGWAGFVWAQAADRSTLARHGLAAYARHPLLNGVGIDRSYYRPPELSAYAEYAAVVPDGFRFVVKAHEALTVHRWPDHDRYAAKRGELNPRFLDPLYAAQEVVRPYAEGLGQKAGALVFQFAPQDLLAPGETEPQRFVDDLHRFLTALPAGPLYAVEVRNREVLTPRYAAMLRDAGAVPCLSRHPRMPEIDEQTAATGALDAPAFVCRWMLRPGLSYQAGTRRYRPFDRLVDEDPPTRRTLARAALEIAGSGRPVLITANNKAEGSAPHTVFRLAAEIVRQRRAADDRIAG